MNTDVLIIGAGPTGLAIANLLVRFHINFRMIDAKAGPVDESRALVMHSRTLELLDKLDLADQAIASGQKMMAVDVLVNGKPAAVLSLNAPGSQVSPYQYSLVYEQSQTERLLLERLKDFGSKIEWNTRLLSLTQTDREATAVIRRSDGREETITAAYVLGADGANSTVRHVLGTPFEGGTYTYGFFLADVEMTWPRGRDKWYLNLTREGFYSFFPMYGGNRFRIVASVTPEQITKGELTFEELRELLAHQHGLGITVTSANWISIYRVHHRMAKQFRVGRCFLVGDAAHIHTPAGGQGMNTGIGDAFNLAWKLALVVNKQAHPDLLESYEQERQPIARAILDGTDKVFGLQVTGNPLWQRARLFLIPPLVKMLEVLGLEKWVYKIAAQMWIEYRKSPVVSERYAHGKGSSVRAGDRAPYGLFEEGLQQQASVFKMLKGVEHHLLLFEGLHPEENLETLQMQVKDLLKGYSVPLALHTIPAGNRTLHEVYNVQKSRLFLIRPDGYIAYSGQATDLKSFSAYLDGMSTRQEL
ncbi:MAG: FAD-dependent monooxygenase [Chloroflexi bacterium]|nr:FAD-dependent monooxygenase [Chloroflexota bacterium]